MASAAIKVVLVVLSVATVVISQDNTKYMDSPVYCGQEFRIGENQVVYVRPRSSVSSSNPPADCRITFTSAQSNTNYKFELTVEAVQITDCALNLNIYDGNGVGGAYLSRLGCSSTTSTGKLYPKSNAVTFHLTRTRYQYSIAGDFSIIVKLYYDKDGADNYIGTDSFPAGAIIGVILAIILLITAGVLLGWCYKTGRLPGMDPYSYPSATKTSTQNLSTINTDPKDGVSTNGGFVAWHNTEGKNVVKESKSNFDLDDSRVWESLTNVSGSKVSSSSEVISVKPPKPPSNWNSGRNNNTRNNDNNNRNGNGRGNAGNFQRSDANQLSNSPNSRIRGRNRGRGGDIDDNNEQYNTINDNFSREGNDRGSGNSGSGLLKKGRQDGVFVNPDKEGYMYDYDHVKKLEGDKQGNSDPKNKTQDFGSELKDAIRRASLKRQKSENQTSDSDTNNANKKNDESSDFASSTALNKTDGETTGPDAHSSPKVKKKKRKSSKERKSPKSGRKHKRGDGSAEGSPKKETSVDDDGEAPPEVYAPIFSGDEDNDVSRDYSHMYQPGYQGNQPRVPPYNQGYPVGPYQPGMPGMYPPGYPQGIPYQQAGQAQWYMEAQPNGQQKMAFAMQTHSQSDDSLGGNHGPPNYTSTPYHRAQGASALVPAGTILDDPHIPKPGTSLMRYDEDPLTGAKTSQVVWTESKRDPTDPPPDSATQVTRKTITRITAKSTKEDLPDNPGPSLQDMSWRAAQQIQATGGQEPQFMSPTRGVYQPNAIQYANETPDRSNASYYVGPREPVRHMKTPPPVIQEDPTRSQAGKAFKDTITLNKESEVI